MGRRVMSAIFEAKIHIMKAETLDSLQEAVEGFCDAAGYYHYKPELSYAENALFADAQTRYGIAELMRLADKRERFLL